MKKINIILNNEKRNVLVEPNDLLLDVLRDKLGVKSPKCGCDRGDCGACTVILNGKTVRSCNILAIEVDEQEILTVEGLSTNGLNDLQRKFVELNAFQCGYCAPGITLAATELLQHNPNPNIEEVKEALSGNLCRCTGYTPILDAIISHTHDKKH